ncbi:MAG: hypothetical protein GY858_09860 [Candidatus Omnitrophica bacterium]|nr:hypothetical protein [Candidatus Omnitrophota bacterium]
MKPDCPGDEGDIENKTFFLDAFKPTEYDINIARIKEHGSAALDSYITAEPDIPQDKIIGNRTPPLTKEDFDTRYKGQIAYDPNISEENAEYILWRRKCSKVNKSIIEQGNGSIRDIVADIGIRAASELLDPQVLWSALVPISSPAFISKVFGKLGAHAITGAAGGAVGATSAIPAKAYSKKMLGEDYTKEEARSSYTLKEGLEEIGLGAVSGGVLGAGIHGAKRLREHWNLKKSNAIIDAEFEKSIKSVEDNHTTPPEQGLKSNPVIPVEEVHRSKATVLKELEQHFPEYYKLEADVASLETSLHEDYGTNWSEANLPTQKRAQTDLLQKKLEGMKISHASDTKFQEILAKREELERHLTSSIGHTQSETGAYKQDTEKLHIAKEQIREGKEVNVADPTSEKSIHTSQEEPMFFENVDEELKHFMKEGGAALVDPEVRAQALNNMLLHKNISFIKEHQSVKIALKHLLQGAELRGEVISKKYLCDFFLELKKTDLFSHFQSLKDGILKTRNKTLERDVARELSNLTLKKAQPGYTESKIALDLAKLVLKHQQTAVKNLNNKGGNIGWLPGYITRQTHSPARLKKIGIEEWKNLINPLLDKELTGNIDLNQVYNNLVSGKHLTANSTHPPSGEPSDILKRLSAERKLHFASADGWYKYNEVCGESGLFSSVLGALENLGRTTGLLEKLGTNPKSHLQDIKTAFKVDLQDRFVQGDKVAKSDMHYIDKQKPDDFLDHIIGTSPENPTAATISKNIRAFKTMAVLGNVLRASIPDIGLATTTLLNNTTMPAIKIYAKLLGTALTQFGKKQKEEFAQMIGLASQSALGGAYGRLYDENLVSGTVSKMYDIYFHANLMNFWDRTWRVATGTVLTNNLAKISSMPYTELSPQLRNLLSGYKIGKENWHQVKRFKTSVNGKDYIVAGGNSELAMRIRDYVQDQVGHGVLNIGAREKAMMYGNTKEGSVFGEALRFFWQFKSFPLAYVTKAMKASTVGNIPLRQQSGILLDDVRQSFSHRNTFKSMSHLLASTTFLGFFVTWWKCAERGETLDPARDPSRVLLSSMTHGGGFGFLGDYLFKEYDSYGKTVWANMAPAVASDLSLVHKATSRAMHAESPSKELEGLRRGYTPGQNLFYKRLALKMLLEEER